MAAKKLSNFTLFLCFFSFPFLLHAFANPDYPDLDPLLQFKASSDPSNNLHDWNTTTNPNPCTWSGVSCLKTHSRVSRLVLENLNLRSSTNSLLPLTSLTQLRVLSLKSNNLSGSLPDFSNCTALKLLFLSHNNFSGSLPSSLFSLTKLYRLDLSYNSFSGNVPVEINFLTHLLTLRLEVNQLAGSLSELNLPNLQDFNISNNFLSGEIPKSLLGFPESAFGQNLPGLCGSPMRVSCNGSVISSDPTKPGSENGAIASPVSNPTTVVSSSPSSLPATAPNKPKTKTKEAKISPFALIAIIIGDVLILALVSLLLYCYFWRNFSAKMPNGKGSKMMETEKIVYSSSPYPSNQGGGGYERGRMVFFEGVRRFELEDLLRASAEMLGKGGFVITRRTCQK